MSLNPKFIKLFNHIAKLNNIENPAVQFSVVPTYHEFLESLVVDQSDFLGAINSFEIAEMRSGKILADLQNTITKRTVVDVGAGTLRKPLAGDNDSEQLFDLREWEHDLLVKWTRLDQMARFKEYQAMYRKNLSFRIAKDRQIVAWQGTSYVAGTTTLAEMDKGFIAKMKTANPANIMTEGLTDQGSVVVGKLENIVEKGVWANETAYKFRDAVTCSNGDNWICIKDHTSAADEPTIATPTANWHLRPHYPNFDALVVDLELLIPEYYREGCVVMTSRWVVNCDRSKLYAERGAEPSEKLLIEIAAKSLGGYKAHMIPFIPDTTLAITSFKNLSWYWQTGSYRRSIENKNEYKGIVDWNSINGTFEVENVEQFAAAENIKFLDLDYLQFLGTT